MTGGAPGALPAVGGLERTFLIADVRGYTRFTRERGDAAAARLARVFAELARDAVEARSGRVIELRGDEALAVFERPLSAVQAAVDLAALCEEEAADDPDLPLRVGVGVDVGEAVPVEDGFRGAVLNMAARLCSQAEGGQVLVSAAVAESAGPLGDISYRPRGRAELKGFDGPVELIEATSKKAQRPRQRDAGAVGDAVVETPPELETSIPLVGREHELAWLRGTWRQARRGNGRLVFLSGPAESGKTRLAAELASLAGSQGACVRYVGAGGAGAARAMAAIEEALSRPTPGQVVILDDLDLLGIPVAEALSERYDELEAEPLLVVGIAREPEGFPELAAVLERADVQSEGHRMLGPLTAQEIHELARIYVGGDLEEVPLESIQRTSRGWPGRVHELMAEWAEREAERRLAAAAEWLSEDQAKRRASLDLASSAIGLKLARLYAGGGTPEPVRRDACPYKGLAAFEASDASFFFGRERLVGELAARLVGQPLLAVVGPSGSGKSSLIAAGLVPSLAAGLLPGSERWTVVSMRPGEHPLSELREALAAEMADPRRRILIVDQFEEAFTLVAEQERRRFIEELLRLTSTGDGGTSLVISLRADFLGPCAVFPELARLISANQVLVGPMSEDELRRAVELPARRARRRVERSLVDALVDEVSAQPGALPLLSTALVELWQHQRLGWLRLESYTQSGGVRGAVARLAEATFGQLNDHEVASARNILLRLVATGEGGSVARRRASVQEFDLERDPVAEAVLSRLIQDRLVTRDGATVEVAHEALLREWPRFQTWLNEDRQGHQVHQHLAQAARQWDERGRDNADLYRGTRLSLAADWASGHGQELNQLERDFLAAGRRAAERAVRRLRAGAGVLAVLLVVAVAGGVLALVQRSQARHAAQVALADSLGAQAIANPRLDQAMLLGVEALRLDPSEQTQGDLLTAVLRAPSAIRTLHGDGLRVNGLAVSPGGRIVALEDNVPNIMFLDAANGHRVGEVPSSRLNTGPSVLDFTPGGKLVLVGGPADRPNQVDLINVPSGTLARRLALPRSVTAAIGPPQTFGPPPNVGAKNFSVSRDGHRLAVAVAGYAVQWSLPQGARLARPLPLPGQASFVFYSPTGRRLVAVGDTRTSVLDATSGKPIRSYPIGGASAALSPDGQTVVYGEADGSVRFMSLRTGTITTSVGAHDGNVGAVAFTPGGQTAITSGDDGKSRVWNVATHQVTQTLSGHAGGIPVHVISPDGSTFYTGGVDGNALAWDLTGKRGLGAGFRAAMSDPAFGAWNIAISRDGRLLAVGASDGKVNVWSTRPLRRLTSFRSGNGVTAAVSFSPDARALLVATNTETTPDHRGQLTIWGLAPAPHIERVLRGNTGPINWTAFNPAGTVVAATFERPGESPTDSDGMVAEWNARTGALLAKPTVLRGGGAAPDVAFGGHGTTVAVAELKDRVAIVDPAHAIVRRTWKDSTAEFSFAAALSPDGHRVATADLDGYLHIWDAANGRPRLPPIRAAEGGVNSVNWSPDGSRVVTAGDDIRLYEADSGREIGVPFPVSNANSPYAVFSQDGRTIAVADASGQAWIYPGTAAGWGAYACRLANRSLTRVEWRRFVPGQPYQRICQSPPGG